MKKAGRSRNYRSDRASFVRARYEYAHSNEQIRNSAWDRYFAEKDANNRLRALQEAKSRHFMMLEQMGIM